MAMGPDPLPSMRLSFSDPSRRSGTTPPLHSKGALQKTRLWSRPCQGPTPDRGRRPRTPPQSCSGERAMPSAFLPTGERISSPGLRRGDRQHPRPDDVSPVRGRGGISLAGSPRQADWAGWRSRMAGWWARLAWWASWLADWPAGWPPPRPHHLSGRVSVRLSRLLRTSPFQFVGATGCPYVQSVQL